MDFPVMSVEHWDRSPQKQANTVVLEILKPVWPGVP